MMPTNEVQIEAHDTCTEDEIIEAIEANFYETLGEDKVENEDLKYLLIQNLNEERCLENENRKIMKYKITVRENPSCREIIESWRERYKFDELAFRNYDYENRSIRIREVH